MTLTDAEIGSLVTVLVVLLTALANYLNHLATVSAIKDNQSEIRRTADVVNGQAERIERAASALTQQAIDVARVIPPDGPHTEGH